ncbi:MAG: ribonuclease H-like domain-containing protein [Planctomycetota bacterium]
MKSPAPVYVVDIETVGVPWKSLDERTREYLLSREHSEAEREAVPHRLSLSPGTGRVIVIGMQNLTSGGTGGVLVEGRSRGWEDGGPMGFKRFEGDEREILTEFWKRVAQARTIVTFNGRVFDGPFLMLRSAMLGVPPSLNLAGYRFSVERHCDLAEVLNFFGAVRVNYGLDYWCRRFGITSPKEEGLDGSQVQPYYEAGRLEEIVSYCVRDVVATAGLYGALKDTLLPLFESRRG